MLQSNFLAKVGVTKAFIFMICMNALSSLGVFGGKTLAEISFQAGNILTPASWTFSIRGIIYVLLFFFVIYQRFEDGEKKEIFKPIRLYVILNFIANGLRLPYVTGIGRTRTTVGLIFVIFGTLIAILDHVVRIQQRIKRPLIVITPFAIYLARIIFATCLNIAFALSSHGVPEILQMPSRVAMVIGFAYCVLLIVVRRLQSLSMLLVGIWALSGIISSRIQDSQELAILVLLLLSGLFTYLFVSIFYTKRLKAY